jgi:hypothetical protein
MAGTVYEAIAQRWLRTPVTAKSTAPHDGALQKWPLVAVAVRFFFLGLLLGLGSIFGPLAGLALYNMVAQ